MPASPQSTLSGRVYLVGAGPGDPGLLTLKALRVLRCADVVLHDELVAAAILELLPPAARVLNVGKRCGGRSTPQSAIHELMIDFARSGACVVRLKAGDPLIFGRAQEEIAALRTAGVPLEIIPGVTAALGAAAALQVPLTARGTAPGVAFVTYQRIPGAPPVDWRPLIAANLTIVIYMPGHDYVAIAADLRNAGLGPDIACAVVSRASAPEQRVLTTDLGRLAALQPLPGPSLLIIGEVARGDRTVLPIEFAVAAEPTMAPF